MLHAKPKKTLEDLNRLLSGDKASICAKVKVAERAALARDYFLALGLTGEDLRQAIDDYHRLDD